MIEALHRWLSFRKSPNFWSWVRNNHSHNELVEIARDATDCSLIDPYQPFGDETMAQHTWRIDDLRKNVAVLMRRYGDEIWNCCMGAGGYDAEKGNTGVQCLAKLDLAFQVYDQSTFEEFLVRNALKTAALKIVSEEKTNPNS